MFRLLLQHWSMQLQAASRSEHGLLRTSAGRWQLFSAARRMASSRRNKKNSDLKGYDFMLHQWNRNQSTGGRHRSATAGLKGGFGFQEHTSSSSSVKRKGVRLTQRKRRSPEFDWQTPWKQTWSDADLAEAAAAAQLHPDEFHNLVFGRDDENDSSSSSGRRKERRKARQAKRRAKRVQQAAKQAWGYAEFSYAWSDSDDESDDDEWQQTYHSSQRPDWQWWDEQQERQWFEQAWRQSNSQQGWQQRHRSQQENDRGGSRSSSSRPWWENFQQSYQRQQQQYNQQQRTQQWYEQQQQHRQQQQKQNREQQQQQHYQNWSSGWQQAGSPVRHPPSVLEYLSVLGLPADATLQRAALKAAFHKAAMQWHPDMHAGEHAKAAAEAKFKLVKEAYESLVLRAAA